MPLSVALKSATVPHSMNSILRVLAFWVLLIAGTGTVFSAQVMVIPLKGEISDAKFFFLRRALKQARHENVAAVVLDMDTYGGSLDAAVRMQEALARCNARTITYVNPNSGSAGALIAISTREIYMAPISAIGAAAPVSAGGEDLPETMREKTISYCSSYFRAVAKQNGHNPDIAEAFINKAQEVKVGGKLIHPAGAVLSLSANQAAEKVDSKPVLAAGIATSIDEVLRKAELSGNVERVEPSGFEQVAFWITTLAPLFLLVGFLGAWIEFKMPGTWLPGLVAAICFIIFFTGHYVAGLAGWEAPAIFAIGLLLVIGELLVHPGTILPGLLGATLMAGSIVWAMLDRYPGQSWLPTTGELIWPMIKLGMAFGLAILGVAMLARYLPATTIYHRLVLATANPAGPSLPPAHSGFTRVHVGDEGAAASILRPSGRAVLGGEPYDVITRGSFVEPGTPLRVVAVEGSRIVVEAVENC